jgi:glucose-1-phosphate cytidylyltransferase
MKVVLFCGGYGMRMRGWDGEGLPKPLQLVGEIPLVVHIMNYYASYGHTDFTLCLGYAADQIRSAIDEAQEVRDFARDWKVDCVDTGLDTPIGERLHLVADTVAGEEMFFANYSDVLTDVDLDAMVARMKTEPETDAMFLAVKPQGSFHIIDSDADGKATRVYSIGELPIRTNGGYLLMRPAMLKRLGNRKDIVPTVFAELAALGRLTSYHHDGFWMPADTFKERAVLQELWEDGNAPWRRYLP